jgi:hypothetical protein
MKNIIFFFNLGAWDLNQNINIRGSDTISKSEHSRGVINGQKLVRLNPVYF